MNSNRLRAAMALHGLTGGDMAVLLGMNRSLYSEKMNGTVRSNGYAAEFTQSEIAKIKDILSLTDTDVVNIFF